MSELKPCPFCGSEAEIVSLHQCEERPVGICCSKCPAIFADGSTYSGFKEFATEAEAIEAWNTRTPELADGGLIADVFAPVCVDEKERRAFERGRVHERFAQQIFKEATS